MRAYLAVIKDSFREAFASRVLWILLLLISAFLLGLAAFGVNEELVSTLRPFDVKTGTEFVNILVDIGQSREVSPGRHIWQMLSDELKQRMVQVRSVNDPSKARKTLSILVGELNDLMQRKNFYDKRAWRDVRANQEAVELQKRAAPSFSDLEMRRWNRLMLDAAFPGHISKVRPSGIRMKYFGYPFGEPIQIGRDDVQRLAKTAIGATMNLIVGIVGVFVAVLVTASIIPLMFESGSIDLLLSKPISRSLLFLTKFFGGCSFIVLHSSYFICGLWLIVGMRFDLWSSELLLCIPVFLFLFAIYYSVSAFVGVIWKNTVMSIVMTIVFWGVCFTVGITKNIIETGFLNNQRLAAIIPDTDLLIVTNKAGKTFQWDAAESRWEEVFEDSRSQTHSFGKTFFALLGPVYDPQANRLVAVELPGGRFPRMRGSGKLVVGKREEQWRRISGISVPAGMNALFLDHENQIVVAGDSGVFRFEGNPSVEHIPFKIFGFDVAPQDQSGKFVKVGPRSEPSWRKPFSAAMNSKNGDIAAVTRGKLIILKLGPQGFYEILHKTEIDPQEPAVLAVSDVAIVAALGNGEIRVFDTEAVQPVASFKPFGSNEPRTVISSPNGRWFAVLFHNRKLWLYDAVKDRSLDADISGQSDISAVAFSKDNTLLVADRFPRVIEYDSNTWKRSRQFAAESTLLERVYRFVVKPIYTIFPKPGELDSLVTYLLTDQETATHWGQEDNLQAERFVLDIWQPIWSNLTFLTIVLGLTCIYVARADF